MLTKAWVQAPAPGPPGPASNLTPFVEVPLLDHSTAEQLLKAEPSNISARHMRVITLSADQSSTSRTASDLPGARLPAIKHTSPDADADTSAAGLKQERSTIVPSSESYAEGLSDGLEQAAEGTPREQPAQPQQRAQARPLHSLSVCRSSRFYTRLS